MVAVRRCEWVFFWAAHILRFSSDRIDIRVSRVVFTDRLEKLISEHQFRITCNLWFVLPLEAPRIIIFMWMMNCFEPPVRKRQLTFLSLMMFMILSPCGITGFGAAFGTWALLGTGAILYRHFYGLHDCLGFILCMVFIKLTPHQLEHRSDIPE